MALAAGAKLGPYEILAPIGAGGMGEVYRARDARLKREVAVKVLPGVYSEDPERLRRFEQEAQAVSALNHPNILSIYDIGMHDRHPRDDRPCRPGRAECEPELHHRRDHPRRRGGRSELSSGLPFDGGVLQRARRSLRFMILPARPAPAAAIPFPL